MYTIVRRIPRGQVRSYAWVARQLGNPHLVRAVGQALKRNPFPDTVPCHRVIHANGSVGGYAWGVVNKRRRLAAEGVVLKRLAARGRPTAHKRRLARRRGTHQPLFSWPHG